MINALYAVGPKGEFGAEDGRLPWGSFPQELENFYSLLEKEFRSDIILVGKKTYETAPPRLKRLLSERYVLVYGRTPPKEWFHATKHKLITQIGRGLCSYTKEIDMVCIGGKTVIELLASKKLLNTHVRSVVTRKYSDEGFVNSRVYLDPYKLGLEDAAIIEHKRGSSDMLEFVQQGVYL